MKMKRVSETSGYEQDNAFVSALDIDDEVDEETISYDGKNEVEDEIFAAIESHDYAIRKSIASHIHPRGISIDPI